jgi:hypothetical protein
MFNEICKEAKFSHQVKVSRAVADDLDLLQEVQVVCKSL